MAICKVIKATSDWNVGDSVEVTGARLKELVDQLVVEVTEPDKDQEPEHKEVDKPLAPLGELKADPHPGTEPYKSTPYRKG